MKNIPKEENLSITKSNSQSLNDMNNFKIRVEKLKMMKEAGLLSDEQFAEEQTKLLKWECPKVCVNLQTDVR